MKDVHIPTRLGMGRVRVTKLVILTPPYLLEIGTVNQSQMTVTDAVTVPSYLTILQYLPLQRHTKYYITQVWKSEPLNITSIK